MTTLSRLEELEKAATPGPWNFDPNGTREGDGPHGCVWVDGLERASSRPRGLSREAEGVRGLQAACRA